jgi:indolepyruvate ferredoxin oxidoreductase alpha subunit
VCALLWDRELRKKGKSREKFTVDQEKCRKCNACTTTFACPAFYKIGEEHYIDESLCLGCGVCAQVCPFGAMVPQEGK